MWALCSNGGYLHSFKLYMGKQENKAIDTIPNIVLGGYVVLNLIVKANLPSNHWARPGHVVTLFFFLLFLS